jgi:hypothetical protein
MLVLIVSFLMTSLYITYNRALDNQVYRVERSLERLEQSFIPVSLVDYYYYDVNSTVTLVLYLSDPMIVEIVRVYIDNRLVDPANYVAGFNQPLPVDTFYKLVFVTPLTTGSHKVVLITDKGGKVEFTITV